MVSIPLAAALLSICGAGETVLLDFQAEWCGPCQMMKPAVQRLAALGYPVREIDIDHDKALAQQYGVTSIPCFVMLVDGQEQGRLVGATSFQQLQQLVARAGVAAPGDNVVAGRGQSPERSRLLPRRRSRSPGTSTPRPPAVSLGQEVTSPLAAAAPPAATSPPNPAPRPQPSRAAAPPMVAVSPSATPAAGAQLLERRLLNATVRLKVHDQSGFSFGSGTIVNFRPAADGGDALVLTCGHIFRDSQGQGRIEVDLFDESGRRGLPGRLLMYDLQRDIGLVSFTSHQAVTPVILAPNDSATKPGDAVASVGCDHGSDPTVHRSRVTAVNSFVGPPNLQVAGQPAVGRSGGGLFDQQGRLIGVCNFADPTDRAGLYAAVELAHDVIAQAGWNSTGPRPAAAPSAAPAAASLAAAGSNSSADEAEEAELICIFRRGRNPKHREQMIVIRDPSDELLRLLGADPQRPSGTFPTSMDVSEK